MSPHVNGFFWGTRVSGARLFQHYRDEWAREGPRSQATSASL